MCALRLSGLRVQRDMLNFDANQTLKVQCLPGGPPGGYTGCVAFSLYQSRRELVSLTFR
jgi:hypothetical protein